MRRSTLAVAAVASAEGSGPATREGGPRARDQERRRRLFSSGGSVDEEAPRSPTSERQQWQQQERGGRGFSRGAGGRGGRGGRGDGGGRGRGRGRARGSTLEGIRDGGYDGGDGVDDRDQGPISDEVLGLIGTPPPRSNGGRGVKVLVSDAGGARRGSPARSDGSPSLSEARQMGRDISEELNAQGRAERIRVREGDWDRELPLSRQRPPAVRGRGRERQGRPPREARGGGVDQDDGGGGGGARTPEQREAHQAGVSRAAAHKASRREQLAARDPRLTGGIQPTQEERAAMAAGVKRSFARAEALPPGEWERLKAESLRDDWIAKIGRRGATKELAEAIQTAWRGREVVKLRVHDDKSARKSVLPRLNLVLRELEELSGGILIDVQGTSIWLYRGPDFVPPPVKPPAKIEPSALLKPHGSPQGAWRELGGRRCYEAGSAAAGPPVVLLQDLFVVEKDTPALMQAADRLASAGGLWVIMPELLTPEDAWKRERYPPESVWKNRFADWLRIGPGNWAAHKEAVGAVVAAALKESQQERPGGGGEGEGAGAPRFAVAGVGWGALLAVWAGTEGGLPEGVPAPAAVAAVAPQLHDQDEKLAEVLAVPLVILPSKYDNMDKLQVYLSSRQEVYERCTFKRFGHCLPGLFSWAPVFTAYDPASTTKEGRKDVKAVAQASAILDLAASFLRRHLDGEEGGEGSGEKGGEDGGEAGSGSASEGEGNVEGDEGAGAREGGAVARGQG